VIVGYLLVLMAFTTSILLIPGERYRLLTTSDSGWFYDLAVDINQTDGMVENNRLSHPPNGMPVGVTDQGQPLMAVMLYKAIHAVSPNVTLMDVVQHWSLLLFALSLIPIFLIGKELGGDLAGCLAAFFAAFLTSTIYWMKFGSFDREASQLVLGAWTIYLTIRLFKAPRDSIPTFAILAGSVYGIYVLTWGLGALLNLAPVIIGGLALVLLAGFIGKLARKTAGLIRSAFLTIRENLYLIVGAAGMLVVMTLVFYVGGGDPMIWKGFAQTLLSYVGIGGGGVIFRYAREAEAPGGLLDTFKKFYGAEIGAEILSAIVLVLIAFVLIKIIFFSRKRWELLVLSWLLVVVSMVWPGRGQARFERLWWPLVPVLAGVGFVAMVSMLRQASLKVPSAAEWLDRIQKPLIIAVCASLIAMSFIQNAYASAERTTPPTEWHGYVSDRELMSTFDWLRENTPENSVVAIEWSYGHVCTGIARRRSVCDGTETLGEEGKWENTATIRPPDYIYVVKDSQAQLRDYRPWMVNGRRIDVQYLPLMDEREFRWLIQTYRDNYGCQIDYVIFYSSWITPESVYYTGIPYYGVIYPALMARRKAQASSFVEEEQNIIFEFENRENVIYNLQTGEVFLQADGARESLASLVAFYVNENGIISGIKDFSFPSPAPDIPETLLLFYDESDNIFVSGGKVQAYLLDLSVPMIVRVFSSSILPYGTDYLEGIDYYAQVVYTSPGGQVTVCRINYVPQPISPSDNAKINDNTPTFRWSSAVGAVKYELWVDDDPTFASPEIIENTSEVTYTSTEALTGENYSWRVRAYDADNKATDWSPTWTFTIDTIPPSPPSPISPENGAVRDNLIQIFTWTRPEPGVTYWIQIGDEADFSDPIHEDRTVTDNSYTYTFSRNDTYYWRVSARDAAYNWSTWSENYELTILAPPGQPTLISPADGMRGNDNTPTFEWTPGSNADNHRLLVDDDNDFSSPEENVLLGATDGTYTIATENGLPDGSYSWKVIAINEVSENESAVWTFTIDTVPPGVPELRAPGNAETVRESTPTFDWLDVSDPSGVTYALEVARDAEFNNLAIAKYDLTASSHKPTAAEALADGTYYWRVRAIDNANNAGDFSTVWSFVVDTRV